MSEILINTATMGVQHQPAIATLDGESFVVVWADRNDHAIKGRIIQPNGILSNEFAINTPTPPEANTDRHLPTIASSGSDPIVAWIEQADNPSGPRHQVKLRRFNPVDGRPFGPEIRVSTTDVDPEHRPAITSMIDGGFLVTWMDARRVQRIRAQNSAKCAIY